MTKPWYVAPNGDGAADVYRGDTATPVVSNIDRQTHETWPAVCKRAMEAEVEPELPEGASAGNPGNSEGLSKRGGKILLELIHGEVIIGLPPSQR